MGMDVKQKFDGYADQYDEWFMKNDKLFTSELRLFLKVLGNIEGKRLLSVGCGSGLFESYIDCSNVEGIEPSADMGKIAEKRGVNVIKYGTIEDVDLPENTYDIIYFNGSSSYMEDLTPVYEKSLRAAWAPMTIPIWRAPCPSFPILWPWPLQAYGIPPKKRSKC